MTSGKGPRDTPYRTVYDAKHTMSESDLPGHLVRAEGGAKVRDQVVNEAYDNVGYVLEFYRKRYGWKSIDDKNADVLSSVHFGHRYENACQSRAPPWRASAHLLTTDSLVPREEPDGLWGWRQLYRKLYRHD